MTNEEAIDLLDNLIGMVEDNHESDYDTALRMGIKALKQEPCEDAISRQAVNTLVDELARAISDERCCMSRGRSTATIMQDILDLPPVIPQPKTGHWIADVDKWGDIVTTVNGYRCNKCNAFDSDKDNYCPNCGCRMVEPQESEVNNGQTNK